MREVGVDGSLQLPLSFSTDYIKSSLQQYNFAVFGSSLDISFFSILETNFTKSI
jgi:hypothetical protein